MKHKVHWITPDVYPVYVGVCFNEDAFWKALLRGGCKRHEVQAGGWTNPGGATTHTFRNCWAPHGTSVAIVTLDPSILHKYYYSEVAAMVAHEIVHVKNFTERCIGEDKLSDEAEAYLVQRLVGRSLDALHTHYKPRYRREK